MPANKSAIITGASGGIGAGLVEAFLKEDYKVVATSLNANQSLAASSSLIPVDGDIGRQETAAKAVEAAIKNFGTIGLLFMGVDTHGGSEPAFRSAFEALAANGVDVMTPENDEFTPTPA